MQPRKILLYLLDILIAIHYNSLSVNGIIGAKNTKPVAKNEHSYVACLIKKSSAYSIEETPFCTATFISTSHLLSTAHCVESSGVHGFVVNAGSHDLDQGRTYTPLWWQTYQKFAELNNIALQHSENDLSIIKLPSAANGITPAPVSQKSPKNLLDNSAKMLGCGLIDFERFHELSKIKMVAKVKVIPSNVCTYRILKHYKELNSVPINYVCSSNKPNVLLADGDFGGPLLLNGELIAINTGIIPRDQSVNMEKRKNLHLSILDYEYFIKYNLLL